MAGLKLDAPFYTEAELDALYESDPVAALRLSREQHALRARLAAAAVTGAPAPAEAEVRAGIADARALLVRDGGDLELVAIDGRLVRVRMKGACAGCPRSALDLRHVVEAAVRRRAPGVERVESVP